MKIAYCDCFSGISGDMFLGALIDAGLSLDELRSQLADLALEEAFELQVKETHKGTFRASQFKVIQKPDGRREHKHRNLADIARLIDGSRLLSPPVKETSLAIFTRLAQAEARTHGEPVEEVHFHEVGALDSIVDIVGGVIGLEVLGIEKLYASPVPLGRGQIDSAHGVLPLPAPAALELLSAVGAPAYASPDQAELVTPTGAAILAELAEFSQPDLVLRKIGVGAGARDLPWPNILRLWLGETGPEAGRRLVLLETNIDDMNPEFYGHVMDRLFAQGALDVYLTPIFMKKNRPATMLSVLSKKENETRLVQILLEETSTLGLRVQPISRYEADRKVESVDTLYGPIPVKFKILQGVVVGASPEYDVCSRLAALHQVPIAVVFNAAMQAARER